MVQHYTQSVTFEDSLELQRAPLGCGLSWHGRVGIANLGLLGVIHELAARVRLYDPRTTKAR